MKIKLLILSIFFSVLFLHASSQKLTDFISYDTMMYVYKLDKEQTNYMVKKGVIEDTSLLFTHLFKTYPRNRFKDDTLPNGNFIVASISQTMINYRYVYKSSFNIKSKVIGDDVIVFLSDKKTEANIEKAFIEIDGLKAPFNDGYGGYVFDRRKINSDRMRKNQVFISVSLGEEYCSMRYFFNEGYRAPKDASRFNDPYYKGVSEGYMITDKPMYKPGDTLNMKAFLTYPKNGRPIRRRARFTITESGQNFTFSKKIKPVSPGAYVFKWAIPDTLKIDRNFNLNLWYNKNNIPFSRTSSFYLEDYVLNSNKYDAQMRSDLFFAGEDITFYVSAKDANQFPISGTQINYKLSITAVQDFLCDSMTLNLAKRSNCYEKDTTFAYESFMELHIPSDSLPKINGNYTLLITFTDPTSFERKVIVQNFSKQTQKEKVLTYQQEDSVFLRCLYNLKDTARPYRVICLGKNDTLFKKQVTTPYSFKLSPYTTRVLFIDKDSTVSALDINFNKLDITKVIGNRSADSVHFSFSFPFDEPVYYRILKGDKLVQSGKSKKLNYAVRDESKDAYSILLTTNLRGDIEQNFYRLTYVPLQHQIKLKSSLPEQAFPGQRIPVTITATDYKDKPLKKINIAAYAVNKQFEDKLTTPQIVIPDKYKDLVEIKPEPSIDNISLVQASLSQNYLLKNHHFAKYNLQKNEYYELRYPKKEMARITKEIQSRIPEFAVTVTHKNIVYTPKYILLDGEPVYISDLNKTTYSFQAKAGQHQIAIRYFDKQILFKNVQFEPGKKYWLGINYDSLKKNSPNISLTDSLTAAQPNEAEKTLLYNSLVFTEMFYFDSLWVGNKKDSNLKYRYVYGNNPQTLNVDGDQFFAFGPLNANGDALFKFDKKIHSLKVSSGYAHHYDKDIKEFTSKKMGAIKGVIFNFYENQLQDYQLASQQVADTIKPVPEKLQMKVDPKAYDASVNEPEPSYTQSYRGKNSNSTYFTLKIKNMETKNLVKAMWIINNSKPDECDFVPEIGMANCYNYIKYTADAKYDIYFLMRNEKLVILKNLSFKNFDEFYINPSLFKSEKLSNDKLAGPLKIYNDLTRLPLLPFYFPPEESALQIKETKNARRNNPYLHGIITDKSLQPIEQAIVLLEVNGKYKMGAYTNSNGEFEILDIPSGSYQVKVFHSDYQIQHIAARFFQTGNEYELNSSLNSSETQRPVFESINLDFRFLSFADEKRKNLFNIRLYDKDTREALKGATINFYNQEKLVDVKSFTMKNEIEIAFPLSETILYTLEIKRPGYIPIKLYNVKFVKNLFYSMHLFLSPEDGRKLITQKEYDVLMQQVSFEAQDDEEVMEPSNAKISYPNSNEKSSITGRILDEQGEVLDYASVVAVQDGIVKGGAKTDRNGYYKIKPLSPGMYELRVNYVGYKTAIVSEIIVSDEKGARVDFRMERKSVNASLKEVVVTEYKTKLISASDPGNKVYISDQYTSMSAPSMSSPVYNYSTGSSASVISINGARTSNTFYMIDGMAIRPGRSVNLPMSVMQGVAGPSAKFGFNDSIYADDNMIDQVNKNADISQSRKKFSDVGYWQPNHITNKLGQTNFEIRFPDNITTWKSNIIAMGKHRLHGIDSSETRVFKPLQTMSVIPQFIWDNDKVYAKAKFSNLTKDEKEIHVQMSLNGVVKINKDVKVKNDYVDSVLLTSTNNKPIEWKAGLQLGEKYKDEEVREIPVYSSAFKQYSNQSVMMDKDSTYKLKFANDTKGSIILNNTLYEKIIAQINELNNYEYGCVEQTSSKLKALLCKININNTMGLKENLNPAVYSLINRLANYQNPDGTWGWWKRESVNWRMTIYAAGILQTANAMGFSNSNYLTAYEAIKANISSFNSSDKVYAIFALQRIGFNDPNLYSVITNTNVDDLRTVDKIYYYKIKQQHGDEVKTSDMYALSLEMNSRLKAPYFEDFFNDPRGGLYIAYYLFAKTSIGNELLQVFKDKLENGQLEQQLNTYSKAAMIEALTSSISNTGNKPITSVVTINDTMKIKTFPYTLPITGSNYKIQHTGGNVFLNTAEERWTFLPKVTDSLFSITTSFIQKGKTKETLEAGIPCQLKVDLKAFRTKEYVMVEIPIPSGMRVTNKSQQSGCTIEYFKHKIVLFYNKLTMDQHQLVFEMSPVLKGSFTLPAAKCSLMYYPYIYGNNETRTVEIR